LAGGDGFEISPSNGRDIHAYTDGKMHLQEYVKLVADALHAHSNPKRALQIKVYLRNQFEFLGIQTPTRRSIYKDLPKLPRDAKLLLQIANQLWHKPEREFRYVACDLLIKNAKIFNLADLPAIQNLMQTDSWWETVDSLSSAIGDIVLNEKLNNRASQTVMDEWLWNSDFWVRRSAMIHQLGWRQHTDTDRLARYALQLSGESEFFIRKAIGWAFRDCAKHNPAFVQAFMQKNGASFSNLTVREATKNLGL
jgi:3-methyladenine DNA glycosylase AlkD